MTDEELTNAIAKLLRKETTLSMAGSQAIAKQIVTLIREEMTFTRVERLEPGTYDTTAETQ